MGIWTPSIVPASHDQDTYLVINRFGDHGTAFVETDLDRTDLETVITDLIRGEHSDPQRVVMLNTETGFAKDVSREVAQEIQRRLDLSSDETPVCLEQFLDRYVSPDRQLTLRLT
jgi:hypothetical protein